GVDHGDVDPVRAQLVGEVLGQRDHRDVAQAADGGAGLAGGQAADVDDAAPAAADHVRGDLAGAAQVAQHLDVDVGPDQLLGNFGEPGRGGLAAGLGGAVDQDVQVAEVGRRLLDHALHRGVVAGVGDDGQHLPPALGGQLGGAGRERLAAAGDQGAVD